MSEDDWESPRQSLSRIIVTLLVVVVALVAFSMLFYILRPSSAGPFYYYPFFFPFGWIFGFFIIFWVLRWLFWPWGWGYRRRRWRYRDESYHILRQRYAKGEITKEQFEQMMRDLERHT